MIVKGISNIFLNDILSRAINNNYLGTFACNMLMSYKIPVNKGLIINLSKKSEIGSHFVAVYVHSSEEITYFDSYGLPCYNKYILDFLKKQKKRVICNKISIQDDRSLFCGFFCMAFILFCTYFYNKFDKSEDMLKTFIKIFDQKYLMLNDTICENLITSLLNAYM